MAKAKKNPGRPPSADMYRKTQLRFSKVEDVFIEVMENMTAKEKKVAKILLEELKLKIKSSSEKAV